MENDSACPTEKAPVRAVLLDVDGTLVDSNEAHAKAWVEVFAEFGHEAKLEEVRQEMGKGGDQLMPVFLTQEAIERSGSAIEERRKELFKSRFQPHLKGFPGTRELVERLLADGRKIVLASSASDEELEVNKRLARIEDLIQRATARDDVAHSKPNPDIFEAALAQLDGVAAAEAMVIGDSPFDAEAAARAGMRCIGLLSGGFSEERLREAGCIAIYRDVADLLANYERSPLAS
jgi:HAD superfamily hydrolase (TIGR01549 family)